MNARALTLALLLVARAASALVAVPPLSARVTDLTGTLSAGERAGLEEKLASFEREKGSQIAVLLVPTTQPETIEQFGIRVADAWKVGRKGVDDGAILIVAKQDRALRIEVGYGLEGAVPDAIANRIVEETIVPRFRAGDFAGGIESGVDQLIRVVEGEPLPPPRRGVGGGGPLPSGPSLLFLIVAPLAVGGLVRSMNRFLGAAVGGALAGALGWWFVGAMSAALGYAAFCFLFILVGGLSGGRRGGWSSGGWGGGYSGGGFGGGGWSGGGGGFGGGGASGRW